MKISRRNYLNSYFSRLMFSFLVVILLLVATFILNDYVLKKAINKQLIDNNSFTIEKAVAKYETEWQNLFSGSLNLIYADQRFASLYNNDEFNFYQAKVLSQDIIARMYNNVSQYIDNTVVCFSQYDYWIDNNGVVEKNLKMSKLTVNKTFNMSFWESQFQSDKNFQFLPTANFESFLAGQSISSKELMPVIVRSKLYPDALIIYFMDINKMQKDFETAENQALAIFNPNMSPIFSVMSDTNQVEVPKEDEQYLQSNDHYYFYETGNFSKLMYVNQVPDILLSSQLRKLNMFTLAMMLLAVLLSIASSLFFSFKLYKPIRRLVRLALKSGEKSALYETSAHELDLISQNFLEVIQRNETLSKNMQKQSSLLETFYYKDQLKNIRTKSESLMTEDYPFRFLLFQVFFKEKFVEQFGDDQRKSTYFYTNFIRHNISQIYSKQQTFQMENNIIVSIVFTDCHTEKILDNLRNLKKILDIDHQYTYFTIVIGSQYKQYAKLTEAYEDSSSILSLRSPTTSTEILIHGQTVAKGTELTIKQERELLNYLSAHKFSDVRVLVDQIWKQFETKQASRLHYQQFSQVFTSHLVKILHTLSTDALMTEDILQKQNQMSTISEYKEYISILIDTAEKLLADKKDDRITNYVQDFIRMHYAGEISLQIVADQLGLSSSYLSAYIKEQTGMNFQEMLNNARIGKATELLMDTDMSMQEIASNIGYYSTNSFFRMFKKTTGITPGEYKKRETRIGDKS